MGESRGEDDSQEGEAGTHRGSGQRRGDGEAEGGRRDQVAAGPLTKAGGEVWAGAVSRRTDALEGAVGVGTDAALAEVLLAAFVHVCRTVSKTGPTSSSA